MPHGYLSEGEGQSSEEEEEEEGESGDGAKIEEAKDPANVCVCCQSAGHVVCLGHTCMHHTHACAHVQTRTPHT